MSAELIEEIANEAMTPQDFASFLRRNDLTQEAAAALLGCSRRQIDNFVSTGPIPRVVALACDGYEARSGAGKERQRPREPMPSTYEQATKEAHAMLLQTAQHFADQLKEIGSDLRRELEATRAALRKGMLELPHETAESVAQMRRIIVDQIEALAELNRIVARHGRGLDIVEPTAQRMEPAAPPPRRDVTSEAHAPPLQSPKAGSERGSWLSDLLTRASKGEPPPEGPQPEHHTIESLDSIAVDIARMIDHEAAAELWDRYKRGERNVFTRKLYTMQGQRASEEIRRKYRSDREFMQTVDRYIAEFERLLDEVSRDDRGQMMAQTYLTSENGKVYTMLALAAGRFD